MGSKILTEYYISLVDQIHKLLIQLLTHCLILPDYISKYRLFSYPKAGCSRISFFSTVVTVFFITSKMHVLCTWLISIS